MQPNNNARAHAAELLHKVVFGGRSLDAMFRDARVPDRERSLIQELTIGSVRHYLSLSGEIGLRLIAPIKPRDSIVLCLLVVGAYQLRHTGIPKYAAVNETVNATRQIGRPWARGLVNQILRRISVEPPSVPSDAAEKWDHPEWLIDLIRADYPRVWQAILTASLSRAPLALRVNLRVTPRDQYHHLLRAQGVSAHIGPNDEALILEAPVATNRLPGFRDGAVSVQDAGAQWAATLLGPVDGERVLDACAAPGGKAMHLLERAPGIELVALEKDSARCDLLRAECHRLRVDPSRVVQGDATGLEWWDGKPFQRILLDAPCSGTGTLRRHPDIKLLKRASDLPQYQRIQGELLRNLWQVLAKEGRLLYCTCSVLSVENDCVIEHFMATTTGAALVPIVADWGVPTRHGRQLLPEVHGPDGFYYAILEKR